MDLVCLLSIHSQSALQVLCFWMLSSHCAWRKQSPFSLRSVQEFFRTGHASVQKIPLQHDIMTHGKKHHDNRIFRPLRLMDRRRVGKNQLV